MKTLTQPARLFRTGLLSLTLATVLGAAAAAPALAGEWRHDRAFRAQEWRGHDRHDHDWNHHDRAYAYRAPGVHFVFPRDIR